MIFYAVLYILIYCFSNRNLKLKLTIGNSTIRIYNYIVPIFFIFFVLAFRNGMGIDDQMYINTFNQIRDYGYPWRDIEIIFVLICKFILLFNGKYQWIFIIYSLISCVLLLNAIKKLVSSDVYPIFICLFMTFVFLDGLVIMRQFLASVLLLNFYVYKNAGKKRLSLIYFILACLSHNTAIVFIIFVFLERILSKYKINCLEKTIILVIMYVYQYVPVVSLVINNIGKISWLQNNYYIRYFLTSGSEHIFDNKLGLTSSILLVICIGFMWISYKNLWYLNRNYIHYENFMFIYWFVMMALSQFGFISRLGFYLLIFTIIYLSYCINLISTNYQLTTTVVFVVSLILFLYSVANYTTTSGNINYLLPYSFNFDLF